MKNRCFQRVRGSENGSEGGSTNAVVTFNSVISDKKIEEISARTYVRSLKCTIQDIDNAEIAR